MGLRALFRRLLSHVDRGHVRSSSDDSRHHDDDSRSSNAGRHSVASEARLVRSALVDKNNPSHRRRVTVASVVNAPSTPSPPPLPTPPKRSKRIRYSFSEPEAVAAIWPLDGEYRQRHSSSSSSESDSDDDDDEYRNEPSPVMRLVLLAYPWLATGRLFLWHDWRVSVTTLLLILSLLYNVDQYGAPVVLSTLASITLLFTLIYEGLFYVAAHVFGPAMDRLHIEFQTMRRRGFSTMLGGAPPDSRDTSLLNQSGAATPDNSIARRPTRVPTATWTVSARQAFSRHLPPQLAFAYLSRHRDEMLSRRDAHALIRKFLPKFNWLLHYGGNLLFAHHISKTLALCVALFVLAIFAGRLPSTTFFMLLVCIAFGIAPIVIVLVRALRWLLSWRPWRRYDPPLRRLSYDDVVPALAPVIAHDHAQAKTKTFHAD